MEMIECAGIEIPLELYRMVQLDERPYTLIHATDPKHKAGVIYEGVRIEGLSTAFDENGKITNITGSFEQAELGYRHFKWTPEGEEKNPQNLEILKLTVFYHDRSQRKALREGRFEQFVSQLPTLITPEDLKIIEYQRWLESTLPKLLSL